VVLLAADVLDRLARAAYRWLSERSFASLKPGLASLGAASLVMTAVAGAAIWEPAVYFGAQAHSPAVIAGFNPTENGVAHETIAALKAGRRCDSCSMAYTRRSTARTRWMTAPTAWSSRK
jgi:hypothetical protein